MKLYCHRLCSAECSRTKINAVNVVITKYHEVKTLEMLQFIDLFTNFWKGRSKNTVRKRVLAAHTVQTLSQQSARTRQINISELSADIQHWREKKIKGRIEEGTFSIEFKRSAVFVFISNMRAARGISPQAFEVSFVRVSPKAAAQLQTPLRNSPN